jgi:hypothetical protein
MQVFWQCLKHFVEATDLTGGSAIVASLKLQQREDSGPSVGDRPQLTCDALLPNLRSADTKSGGDLVGGIGGYGQVCTVPGDFGANSEEGDRSSRKSVSSTRRLR